MSPQGIANRALSKFKIHLGRGYRKIILCLDRKERSECPGDFAAKILARIQKDLQLAKHELTDVELIVVVADRMFEAWILADAEGLRRKHLPQSPKNYPHCFEGRNDLKGLLSAYLGEAYRETLHGPKLFAQVNFAEARKGQRGSKSLDKFLRSIGLSK